MAFLRKIRWAVEYCAVRLLAVGLMAFPLRARLWVGRELGRLAYTLDFKRRKVAVANLEAAYPEGDDVFRRTTAKGAYLHLGRLLVEILSQRPSIRGVWLETRIEGWEHLQEAASLGGYFLVSAHFGNWERVAHVQGALGYPLWMITRPLDNPYLERYLAVLREGTGNRVIHKRTAVREIVRGVKKGKGIAIVIDQNFGEKGRVFVPFFGRAAATTPILGRLAVRLGAPVLPVFAYPEEEGGYRIVYGPPVEVPSTSDREADALKVTEKATARVEEAVRINPRVWFWMHRRWRTRPGEEKP